MSKKFVNLDKKWKEIVYALSGFGPNLLMVLMGAYFSDAVNPSALPEGSLQAISSICLITPGLFSILWFIGKVFDGIIDIPFASITDNLKTIKRKAVNVPAHGYDQSVSLDIPALSVSYYRFPSRPMKNASESGQMI